MNTHTIGTETFGVFEKSDKKSLLMLHFLWGKMDFRVFLERSPNGGEPGQMRFKSNSEGDYYLSRLQYLFDYEWYDYDKVSGHGLAHDEVRWVRGKAVRYLELPLHFREIAADLACMEFGLDRLEAKAQR